MASPVERLIAMRHELDTLIAEMQGMAPPPAPKKSRGRPKVAKDDMAAARVAGGEAAAAIEGEVVAEKPRRVLTDEQKAKMKAGREAAKARKEMEKAALEAAKNSAGSDADL